MENRVFPLWAFTDYDKTVITRGETQAQAWQWASRNWERGQTVTPLPYCPIWAADEYDKNHSLGWLERVPYWLASQESAE